MRQSGLAVTPLPSFGMRRSLNMQISPTSIQISNSLLAYLLTFDAAHRKHKAHLVYVLLANACHTMTSGNMGVIQPYIFKQEFQEEPIKQDCLQVEASE